MTLPEFSRSFLPSTTVLTFATVGKNTITLTCLDLQALTERTGSPAPSASSGGGVASTDYIPKPKPKGAKPPNVFSNDGSFLDRIRRSMKEEEDKKKEKEALERKKHFADRFKTRGKRPPPTTIQSAASDTTTPETDESPTKKLKLDGELSINKGDREKAGQNAQAEYHKAMESYPGSLKDGGTGVRPLIK